MCSVAASEERWGVRAPGIRIVFGTAVTVAFHPCASVVCSVLCCLRCRSLWAARRRCC